MKTKRHRFRPEGLERLESRLALTHGGTLPPALIGTLSPTPNASGRTGKIVAQINSAFVQFTNDYMQAQGAYFSSNAPQATFMTFTVQRTNLLANELTRIFARLPGSFNKIQDSNQRSSTKSSVVMQAFLTRNINGAGNDPNTGAQSLLRTLTSANLTPMLKPTGAGATLYTLAANDAIQTALTATINAAKFIASGTFKH